MSFQTEATESADVASRVIIRAGWKPPIFDVREIWAYREVLIALVRREIKIRYAQTIAGVGWAVLQPVLTTLILSAGGRWIGLRADGLPYPLFAYSGLVLWIYFTHVLNKSTMCLLSTGLLGRAYFPRLLLPLAAVIGGLIDFFVASTILLLLMVRYRVVPGFNIVLLPLCIVLLILFAFGAGVWLAVLNLHHRDIAHALPFATQVLFFLTPVAYSSMVIPQQWRLLYSVNPVTGVIECFRWALLGQPLTLSPQQLALSLTVGAAVTMSGLFYFSRQASTLADVGNT